MQRLPNESTNSLAANPWTLPMTTDDASDTCTMAILIHGTVLVFHRVSNEKKGPFCCLGYMSGMKFPTQLCEDYHEL